MRLDEGLQDQKLSLDITPLIDIIFLLVLFFAVSTSFISGEDLAALQTDVVVLGEAREQLTEEVEQKQAQIQTLQTDFTRMVEEKTAELTALAEKLEQSEGEASKLEFMVSALENQRVDLQARLDQRAARNTSLQQQLEQAYQDFQDLNAELTSVRSEAERQAEQQRLLRGLLAEREREREQLASRNAALREERSQLEQQQEALGAEKADLAEQLRTLRGFLDQERAASEAEQARIEAERSELADRNQDLASQMAETRAAVERLTGELAAREQALQSTRNTLDQTAAQEVLLQKLLAEKAAELDGMRVRLESASAARDDLRETLEQEQAASEATAEQLRAEARGLQTQVLRLQAELNKYREVAELDREQIERILRAQEQLNEGMATYLEDNSLGIKRDQQRLTLQLSDKVLFDSGSPDIKREGLDVLRSLGRILKERSAQLDIQIGGHTDNIPIAGRSGPLGNNWGLSAARAVNVVRFFEDEVGLDPKRMSAVGYGEHRPVGDNTTAQGRAQNRRIEIVLLPR